MSKVGDETADQLSQLGEAIRDDFARNRRVLSFGEYLDLMLASPERLLRSSQQYVRDAFEHYGFEKVEYPWGEVRRFHIFDCPWADGRERLVGQEEVQNRVYRAVQNFVNEGTANKLVLLHGPNGSAKTTLIRCVGRGLQHYSTLDDGALYRINWVFPATKVSKGGIGFGGGEFEGAPAGESFAHLPDEVVDAKLVDELRDHPVFLIPPDQRQRIMADALEARGDDAGDFVLSDYIQFGQLSHKNRIIYEALLANYQGDYLKVLRHVQIERFYVQHRYRTGYVTVEPQLAVDAQERQVTADRSMSALPSALQSASLFEYGGPLVDANRGMIEYSDLLKRPLEAFKYLLTTVERSSVSMQSATLFLDLIYIGTSNEVHLNAFKELPDFQSFKGRLELVRVPYLLDYRQEREIYSQKLKEAASNKHIAPHCDYVAALWAVLTRMRKPMVERYEKSVGELVGRLSPLDKAELYATGRAPKSFSADEAKRLDAYVRELWSESGAYPNYEGRTGASPREMQAVLFNAANSAQYDYVSPLAIFDELDELCKGVTVYSFLKQEPLPGGFHENRKFIDVVRGRWLDEVDEETRDSLGLIEQAEYARLFRRYVEHALHFTKKEKVESEVTGQLIDPDQDMMRDIEKTLGVTADNDDFRHDLISRIGAWSLDHPGQKPVYEEVFPDMFKRLRDSYFEEQRKVVKRALDDLVAHLTDGARHLDAEDKKSAERAVHTMIERYGYTRESARDAITVLVRARYAE